MSRFLTVLLILIPLSLSALDDNSVIVCPAVFPGCTDPVALNYNDEATEDDGTCVYSTGPDPIIIDLVVNNEECEVFEAGILSTFEYSATITNIGTEAVTNFCLNDFLGITFNCFNGVSNLAVWIQPGDTITVYGNINVEGTWFEGQGNFMTITSVPGEIITANNNFVFYMPYGVDCEEVIDPEPCDTIFITLPPDTVIFYQVDTVITQEYVYLTDTLIEYIADTVIVDNYIYTTDTLEVEILEYVFLTDTIVEIIEVDCNTNLPCNELIVDECWPWSIFIPNVMTPNNDGVNDVWQIILDLECWVDVEFKIYNRWGGLVFEGYGEDYSSYPYWDGSMQGGPSYVADGMYVYTFYARKHSSPEIYQKSGHLTILR